MTDWQINDHGPRGGVKEAGILAPTEHAAVARYLVEAYGSRTVGYTPAGMGTYELTNGRTLTIREED